MNRFFIALTALVTLVACKKNSDLNDSDRSAPTTDPYKNEFVTCNCSAGKEGTEEYLQAEINGVKICADIKGQFGDYPFGNMLKHGNIIRGTGTTYYDNLYMIRYTNDGKFMLGIFLENTHTLTKQYPYQLPRTSMEYCEIGELQLENQQQITPDMCAWCPSNNWHYYSPFGNNLTYYAEKFENNILEGRFEGNIRTGSGRIATVTNGKFRIMLTLIYEDIILP